MNLSPDILAILTAAANKMATYTIQYGALKGIPLELRPVLASELFGVGLGVGGAMGALAAAQDKLSMGGDYTALSDDEMSGVLRAARVRVEALVILGTANIKFKRTPAVDPSQGEAFLGLLSNDEIDTIAALVEQVSGVMEQPAAKSDQGERLVVSGQNGGAIPHESVGTVAAVVG